jgi:hypothetical protein
MSALETYATVPKGAILVLIMTQLMGSSASWDPGQLSVNENVVDVWRTAVIITNAYGLVPVISDA